jgi:8-oxo-dGTP pyrophosphatase MutT (NUDIX family)
MHQTSVMRARGDGLVERVRQFVPQSAGESDDVERVLRRIGERDAWDRSTGLHVTGSALIVHPPTERVLLRWHARQQAWLQIGGHGDDGEDDPIAVAIREGAEEAGLDDLRPWPSAVLQHIVIVPVPANDREPAHEHADVRCFLATDRPDDARPENPDAQLQWLTTDEAIRLTSEENVRETIRRLQVVLAG